MHGICPAQDSWCWAKEGVDAWHLDAFEDFNVRDCKVPLYLQTLAKTVKVKYVQLLSMGAVDSSCFARIKQ